MAFYLEFIIHAHLDFHDGIDVEFVVNGEEEKSVNGEMVGEFLLVACAHEHAVGVLSALNAARETKPLVLGMDDQSVPSVAFYKGACPEDVGEILHPVVTLIVVEVVGAADTDADEVDAGADAEMGRQLHVELRITHAKAHVAADHKLHLPFGKGTVVARHETFRQRHILHIRLRHNISCRICQQQHAKNQTDDFIHIAKIGLHEFSPHQVAKCQVSRRVSIPRVVFFQHIDSLECLVDVGADIQLLDGLAKIFAFSFEKFFDI